MVQETQCLLLYPRLLSFVYYRTNLLEPAYYSYTEHTATVLDIRMVSLPCLLLHNSSLTKYIKKTLEFKNKQHLDSTYFYSRPVF